jgi:predicted phosphoribosyltransferase
LEFARELNAPLDVFLVRKFGVPGHRELAIRAIASGGVDSFSLRHDRWLVTIEVLRSDLGA